MPKYRLLAQHYIDDRLLEAGTVIGEGTDVPFLDADGKPLPPTPFMEGLDKASKAETDKVSALDIDASIAQSGVASEPING